MTEKGDSVVASFDAWPIPYPLFLSDCWRLRGIFLLMSGKVEDQVMMKT